MTELNFGPIDYSRFGPGARLVEKIIIIPEIGDLWEKLDGYNDNFGPEDVEQIIPEKTDLLGHPTITLKRNIPDTIFHEGTLYIVWIKERREWIGIEYDHWVEASSEDDELYSGPWKLRDFLTEKILEAYGITSFNTELTADKVRRMSPAELEDIHKEMRKS